MQSVHTFLKKTLAALLFAAAGFTAMAAAAPTTVTDVGGSPGYPEFQDLSLQSDRILAESGMAIARNEPWCSSWTCYLDGECGIGCTCVRFDWYTGKGYCVRWW